MGLQDALRKAASLIIEIPPAETETGSEAGGELADLGDSGLPQVAQPDSPPLTGEANARTVEQIVRAAQGPDLDAIAVSADTPVPPAGAALDLAAVYAAAKLPEAAFTAEQMLDMLTSLPSELPLETKRKTVQVMLGALGRNVGATPESIVTDASRKMAALAAYEEFLTKRSEEFVAQAENEIVALQKQLEEKRRSIAETRESLARSEAQCEAASRRLNEVLRFFSLNSAPPEAGAPEQAAGEKGRSSRP